MNFSRKKIVKKKRKAVQKKNKCPSSLYSWSKNSRDFYSANNRFGNEQWIIKLHNCLQKFFLYQARDINWLLRSPVDKSATAEFSLLCKRTEYISRDTGMAERKERVQRRDSPYPPFVLLHALPRGEQGRQDGAWKKAEEGRERRTRRDSPESTRPPPWSPRIVEFAFGEEALLYRTSPHRARFSAPLLFCILHWRWDLVVRFADAPPFRPSSHRTHGIVLLLQEQNVTSYVSRG